jgi:hypothetical protein
MMLGGLREKLERDKSVQAGITEAARILCPGYQMSGIKPMQPCLACMKNAALIVTVFLQNTPSDLGKNALQESATEINSVLENNFRS